MKGFARPKTVASRTHINKQCNGRAMAMRQTKGQCVPDALAEAYEAMADKHAEYERIAFDAVSEVVPH